MIRAEVHVSSLTQQLQGPRRAPRWKWLLMLGVLLIAAMLLGATLRSRPAIGSKEGRFHFAADSGFRAALARVDAAGLGQIERAGLQVADPADWLTICRRLSLALV